MIKTVTKNIFVSVPIRGLFNLTSVENPSDVIKVAIEVSVPIRGLFNLIVGRMVCRYIRISGGVSVPIRRLFNLTGKSSSYVDT